jgi:hypothetical protein
MIGNKNWDIMAKSRPPLSPNPYAAGSCYDTFYNQNAGRPSEAGITVPKAVRCKPVSGVVIISRQMITQPSL